MMFSVCAVSFSFIMCSSCLGMPVSGTQAVVGSLLGAGWISAGFKNLPWEKLGTIVLSWFASPALAAFISFNLMMLVTKMTMRTNVYSYRARLLWMHFIAGLCFVMMFFLFDKILRAKQDKSDPDYGWGLPYKYYIPSYLGVGFLSGILFCRFLMLVHL